jgi:hypothetical protein
MDIKIINGFIGGIPTGRSQARNNNVDFIISRPRIPPSQRNNKKVTFSMPKPRPKTDRTMWGLDGKY